MKTTNLLVRLFLCLLVFAFVSCDNWKDGKQEKDKSSKLEDALKETNQKILSTVLSGDYDTILKFYSDDVIIVPNFHQALKGKSAVRESYQKEAKEGTKFHSFNAKAEKIWELNNDIYEYGTYGLSVSTNETKHPYAFTGSYFMIWEKQKDKSYLIKYIISNLDFNPCKDYY